MIGSRLGGNSELVRYSAALAEVLGRFAARPDEQIAAMGREGAAWVKREFTATRCLERIFALYDGLAQGREGAARTVPHG